MNKLQNKILEFLWLVLALFALGAGIHKSLQFGFKYSYLFYIIAFIALAVFLYKRNKRLKSERTK